QLTAARERSDITLFDQARAHLEQAKDFLSPDVYDKLKDRIDKEREFIAAQKLYENLLVLATNDSSDEDAQWVDEVKLANEINSIEDPNLRSLVWKLANEDKSRREAARRDVVNKYAASAIKTFWDTRSITKTLNSAEMQWLERNDLDEWNRVREQIERWVERWRREERAIRSEQRAIRSEQRAIRSEQRAIRSAQRAEERLQLSRQARADKDPENIRL